MAIEVTIPVDSLVVTDAVVADVPDIFDIVIPLDTSAVFDSVLASIIESAEIADARNLDPTTVRVDFTKQMLITAALTDPASYALTPLTPGAAEITVQSVDLPVGQTFPSFVRLNTTEHTDGATYQAQLLGGGVGPDDLQSRDNEPAGSGTDTYIGEGEIPSVALVVAIDQNSIQVRFTELMADNFDIRDIRHYVFDNGLDVTAVLEVAGAAVTLQTTDQVPGLLYALTVLGDDFTFVDPTDVVVVTDSLIAALVTGTASDVTETDAVAVTDSVGTELVAAPVVSDVVSVIDTTSWEFDPGPSDAASVSDSTSWEFDPGPSDVVATSDSVLIEIVSILPDQVVKGSVEDTVVYGSGGDIVIAGSP